MARWHHYVEPDAGPYLDRPGPEPDVPHALGVIFGSQVGWSPERENQRPGRCRICGDGRTRPDGSEDTLIPEGSRIYCAGCGRYGLDDQVREVLAITPAKPRHRACVVKPSPRKKKSGKSVSGRGRSG